MAWEANVSGGWEHIIISMCVDLTLSPVAQCCVHSDFSTQEAVFPVEHSFTYFIHTVPKLFRKMSPEPAERLSTQLTHNYLLPYP